MPLNIASWNVNSLKARQEHVVKWLQENAVDVLFLQELKGEEFPEKLFMDLGYHSVYTSQKAYNGVAILSKHPINLIADALPQSEADDQARYLEADIAGIRHICIYLPNGNPVDSDKLSYKHQWMQRLYDRLATLRNDRIPFLVGGDFNIIPHAIDCANESQWVGDALYLPESRALFQSFLNLGLIDAWRTMHPNDIEYSFWDYQAGAWQRNNGIRIDHFLTSPTISDRILDCKIDKIPRSWDRPSDHVPIILTLL
jgi:exodeoxyribonuclease-3